MALLTVDIRKASPVKANPTANSRAIKDQSIWLFLALLSQKFMVRGPRFERGTSGGMNPGARPTAPLAYKEERFWTSARILCDYMEKYRIKIQIFSEIFEKSSLSRWKFNILEQSCGFLDIFLPQCIKLTGLYF